MAKTPIHTLDLKFQGRSQAIASYLIRHSSGAVLIESGPGSTVTGLQISLQEQGLKIKDVTHVLLTHIHLDHAGAAGYLARQGAQVFVHPVGAPHLLQPEKLLASAARIYGDKMNTLWGEFLPVPEEKLTIVRDSDEIAIGNLRFLALDTPGHAEHHHAYLFEETCFSGDIGGVRMPDLRYLRLPLVPPELHLEKWRSSIKRLQKAGFERIAPTHFGLFNDPQWHLEAALKAIDQASRWVEEVMPSAPSLEELGNRFTSWMETQGRSEGIDPETLQTYELANPTWMAAAGIQRYWRKVRMAS
jgi:glyoxylase-like metal-dependent hydrolase (beta-lactamase superfamily II)